VAEDPSQIREAIEETRAEIARTMEALGHKADVKQRLRHEIHDKSDELKTQLSAQADRLAAKWSSLEEAAKAGELRPAAPSWSDQTRKQVIAVGVGVLLLMLILRRTSRG
jgi:preprotein translocase subunit SecF